VARDLSVRRTAKYAMHVDVSTETVIRSPLDEVASYAGDLQNAA
jgi:hypothetical protein